MGSFIAEDMVEAVRQQVDMVELVGEYVRLQKKGKDYVGLCPFHQEKTPSFTVSGEKQIFHCFGCGVGGNVYKFIMLVENLPFPEAVKWLAAKAGLQIPVVQNREELKKGKIQDRMWEINSLAKNFYRSVILTHPGASAARNYLSKRGLDEKTQERFNLGYAPDSWTALVDHLVGQGCRTTEMLELGLAAADGRGSRVYDRFRGRIMFPISNPYGKVMGFGGRVLADAAGPKYLNTKQTSVFSKGHILYGLDLARASIREKGYAIIMEGYMDVITAHQFGITGAVASLGTSLTEEQCKLLLRYTPEVIIAYDADAAGISATLRGLDLLQAFGCRVRIVTIPEGKDPDEYIRRHGIRGWETLIQQAQSLLEYKINQACSVTSDTKKILQKVIASLAGTNSPVEQEEGIKTIASRLNLSWEVVKSELKQFKAGQLKKWPVPDKIAKNTHNIIQGKLDVRQKAEQEILSLILHNPEYLPVVKEELGDWFPDAPTLQKILLLICQNKDRNPLDWMNILDDREQATLSRLMMQKPSQDNAFCILNDLIAAVKAGIRKEKRSNILQKLAQAERVYDKEQANSLLKELQQLLEVGDKEVSVLSGEGERTG